jgi:uncharacterized protein (TIGR02246 family)
MRTWTLLALPALILGLAACEAETEEAGSTTEDVAAVDVAAIDQTIRARAQEFDDGVAARDPAAIAALYADDTIIQAPGEPAMSGPGSVEEDWAESFERMPDATGDGETENVMVAESGELAVETGRYTFSGTAPDGTAISEDGKYITVWKLQDDGTWKIAVESYSSNSGADEGADAAAAEEEPGPSE